MSTNKNVAWLLGWRVVFAPSKNKHQEDLWVLCAPGETDGHCFYNGIDAWQSLPDFEHSNDACEKVCNERGWEWKRNWDGGVRIDLKIKMAIGKTFAIALENALS